jgi:hypothetical protein
MCEACAALSPETAEAVYRIGILGAKELFRGFSTIKSESDR